MNEADLRTLRELYSKTSGMAWEPPVPNYPWLVNMIEAGYLKRCNMRCGLEAFTVGIEWTDAGRRAVASSALSGLFGIGDEVAVIPGCDDWADDWQHLRLWIAAIHALPGGGFDYTVTKTWPLPENPVLTDGFYMGVEDEPDALSLVARASDQHYAPDNDAQWLRNLAKIRFNQERLDIAERLERIADRIQAKAAEPVEPVEDSFFEQTAGSGLETFAPKAPDAAGEQE